MTETNRWIERSMDSGTLRYHLLDEKDEWAFGFMSSVKYGRTEETAIDVTHSLAMPATALFTREFGAELFYCPAGHPEGWLDANVSWFVQQKILAVEYMRDEAVRLINENDRDAAFGFLQTAIVAALEMFEVVLKACWIAHKKGDPPRNHGWARMYECLPSDSRSLCEKEYKERTKHMLSDPHSDYPSVLAAIRALDGQYVCWRYWISDQKPSVPINIDFVVLMTFHLMGMFRWDNEVPAVRTSAG